MEGEIGHYIKVEHPDICGKCYSVIYLLKKRQWQFSELYAKDLKREIIALRDFCLYFSQYKIRNLTKDALYKHNHKNLSEN